MGHFGSVAVMCTERATDGDEVSYGFRITPEEQKDGLAEVVFVEGLRGLQIVMRQALTAGLA